MKSLLILPLIFCLIVPACSNEPTPSMVGAEALKNLPPGPEIKPSASVKNIRAEGPAGGSAAGGMAPSQ